MNSRFRTCVLLGAVACSRGSHRSDQVRVDTTLTFIALPPPSARDSANAPSGDSVLATIRAYREQRIAAEVAAPIIVDYLLVGGMVDYSKAGGTTSAERERELHAAVTREFQRRVSRARRP